MKICLVEYTTFWCLGHLGKT